MAKPVAPRGLARDRVLDAALALFAECGVHGTSLKMIADRIGVSKAAVYYQFQSKEDIALEVMRPTLEDLARVIRIADALPDWQAQRAVATSGIVEMAVRHRRLAMALSCDPAMDHLLRAQPEMKAVFDRLNELLVGPEPDSTSRVAAAVFFAGIGMAAADPQLTDVDDDDLRRVLLDLSNRILQPAAEHA
ncbi:TetR/AcrR family transcriptional regulator [Mycolicibacterium sp. Dal123E01]|uniref:TetR/AcrR family transcriptional regulator n=1 Tax=Mycolicibacterium sp. Dal123E01 TaxID=3457578 RepID=UPI00403E4568